MTGSTICRHARTLGRSDVRTLGRPDARTPGRPGVRTPGRSDACPPLFSIFAFVAARARAGPRGRAGRAAPPWRRPSPRRTQKLKKRGGQASGRPGVRTARRLDVRASERPAVRKSGRPNVQPALPAHKTASCAHKKHALIKVLGLHIDCKVRCHSTSITVQERSTRLRSNTTCAVLA